MKKIYFDKDAEAGGGYVSQKKMAAVEKELVYNYKASLTRITRELDKMAAKIDMGGALTIAEMNKYNRLTSLLYNINYELSQLIKASGKVITSFSKDQLIESYKTIAYKINQAVNGGAGTVINYQWGMINPDVIKASVQNPLYLTAMEDLKASIMIQVKREITQSLIQGDSVYNLAKKIKDRLGVSASRARTIARTEAGKAWSEGHQAAHDRAEELGIETYKVWVSTLDSKTRDTHRSMDQQVADEDGYFKLPGGIKVQGPRLGGPAKEVINCRCRMMNVVKGFKPTQRMSRDVENANGKSGPIVDYQTYDEWAATQE